MNGFSYYARARSSLTKLVVFGLIGLFGGGLFLLAMSLVVMTKDSQPNQATVFNVGKPPGRLIPVGSHFLHAVCSGHGRPVVVIESGLGESSFEWLHVMRLLQDELTVCTYDRAGYTWSQLGPGPRTSAQIVKELRRLLSELKLSPPFLLVGHSFGGYMVQLYASRFPDEVAGLLLIESSHPRQGDFFRQIPGADRYLKTPSLTGKLVFRNKDLSEALLTERRLNSSHRAIFAQREEIKSFEVSAREVLESYPLPDIPLVVLSRGQRVWPDGAIGDQLETTWNELQRDLARLTPNSVQRIAKESGHLIHLQEPELVVTAIRDLAYATNHDTSVK